MNRKPLIARPLPAVHSLPERLHPVLKRVYLGRGVLSVEDLDYSLSRLPSPFLLPGMAAMTERLGNAVREQKRILVVADYDADGATACAVAVKGLRALGAQQVDFVVPDRFRLGYGLTPGLVEAVLSRRPQVLLTVDNGISSLPGVQTAKSAGMEVLVTDHHLPGEKLPEADAIVNPNLSGSIFPSTALAGVGVMFYVLCAVRAELRKEGWFSRRGIAEPKLKELLDLVALGTVADVVPLDGLNRILVYHGLKQIRRAPCPGIQALLEVAGCCREEVVAADLGFALGPRLNAAGRLEDMTLGIRCLLSENLEEARVLARRLDSLNRERQRIEAKMQAEAAAYLDSVADGSRVPCLFAPSWHEGVVGILAARLRDRLKVPAIAFALGRDGLLKGSARSIPGLHIRDLLAEIDASHPGLIARYGGHAMAAGLSLQPENYPRFSALFAERLAAYLAQLSAEEAIYTDGYLNSVDFSSSLATELRFAGPWGQGFPEPLFHGEFEVQSAALVKDRHLRLSVRPTQGPWLKAVAFNLDDKAKDFSPLDCHELRLAYRLDLDQFQGSRAVQLTVEYLEPVR